MPLDYDDLMRSMVYDPRDVPKRLSREEIGSQLHSIKNQYDNEDFDLGIKQFMIEQSIQAVSALYNHGGSHTGSLSMHAVTTQGRRKTHTQGRVGKPGGHTSVGCVRPVNPRSQAGGGVCEWRSLFS